jgi:hypothetical protein
MVTILPARCYVAHEWIVKSALQHALAELPHAKEGVITLGMSDMEESYDEDYLIVERRACDGSLRVVGYARRPVRWVGAHLKRRGALVASKLLVGYASVLASHVSAMWPGISRQLIRLVSTAVNTGAECVISGNLARSDSRLPLSSIRWRPPGLPQRALLVRRSGWNGLCSPRAVAQLTDFYNGSLQEGDDSAARRDSFTRDSPASDFAATSRG